MSKINIVKADITKLSVDCVVNAANSSLLAGGGVCGAIFAAAGARELQAECDLIGGCETGSAVITPGFALKAKYVIHAVGPVWRGGHCGEEDNLYSCYQASLKLAVEKDCGSIAFPLISSGIYGYPKENAWRVAIRSVRDFLRNSDSPLYVTFAVISDDMLALGNEILGEND